MREVKPPPQENVSNKIRNDSYQLSITSVLPHSMAKRIPKAKANTRTLNTTVKINFAALS